MINTEIEQILTQSLSAQTVIVKSDGSHFHLIVVSDIFSGMSRLRKEQAVYAPLMEYITDNRIHAVNIRAFTPEEWHRDRKLLGY